MTILEGWRFLWIYFFFFFLGGGVTSNFDNFYVLFF